MSRIVFGSVCSGIEAASVAWLPLGWRPSFYSEIDAFPRAVLAHHHPEVPVHGDFTTIQADQYEPIDLLVGGTPCQSFSVAGRRLGLDDPRGNLAIEFCRLARRLRPRWVVWENVPGVLSSNGGRDFGAFLGLLGECGYGWGYRVLDAQYVRVDGFPGAVPQRRRRVFVVGYLGDWRRAAAVLFEPEGMRGDPAPRRAAGEGIAPTIASRPTGGGGLGTDFDLDGGLIAAIKGAAIGRQPENGPQHGDYLSDGSCFTLLTNEVHAVAHALRAEGFDASEDGTGRGTPLVPVSCRVFGDGAAFLEGDATAPLTTGTDRAGQVLAYPAAVRRLTPRECERLQGFPDDYTLVPYRGKLAADGPRYKALGNSMAVNVMSWIGQRIDLAERVLMRGADG